MQKNRCLPLKTSNLEESNSSKFSNIDTSTVRSSPGFNFKLKHHHHQQQHSFTNQIIFPSKFQTLITGPNYYLHIPPQKPKKHRTLKCKRMHHSGQIIISMIPKPKCYGHFVWDSLNPPFKGFFPTEWDPWSRWPWHCCRLYC